MKKKIISDAITNINSEYIEKASDYTVAKKTRQPLWVKWGAIAACFCLCAMIGIGVWQSGMFGDVTGPTSGQEDEIVPTENYVYKIEEGQFSTYIGGKVIVEDKIGGKIADVTLTAGWRNAADTEWLSKENLRGEVYTIEGIGNDIAVALKFIDKGEAVTTTHYYVMMNPNADLSSVEDYIISPSYSNNAGDVELEVAPTEKYNYRVNEDEFSAYIGGKVITEDKIGGKIADVTLIAGWRNAADTEWLSEENLRGEVYAIEGIANDVAVALKFIDKGEAVTTTHYYVMMNPNADLSAVADYMIQPVDSGNTGDIVME